MEEAAEAPIKINCSYMLTSCLVDVVLWFRFLRKTYNSSLMRPYSTELASSLSHKRAQEVIPAYVCLSWCTEHNWLIVLPNRGARSVGWLTVCA